MSDLPDSDETADHESSRAIARKLAPFLRPDKKAEGVQVVETLIQRTHSGPLPAPEDFAHYEHVLPGAAERIFQLTEREQEHRHRQESRMVTGEYATRIIGQIGALLALALLLAAVVYTAAIGQPVAAGVIAAIGGVVVHFTRLAAKKTVEPEPKQQNQPRRRKKA